LADEPDQEKRGVFNSRVVDLVSWDETRDEVVLMMLEDRPWQSDPEQLRQLEDKFNAYLSYVLEGHMVQQYPQYENKAVCFQLDCAESPRGEVRDMLRTMQNFAAGEGLRFVVQVIQGKAH
jgi:hypothetical protein